MFGLVCDVTVEWDENVCTSVVSLSVLCTLKTNLYATLATIMADFPIPWLVSRAMICTIFDPGP